MKGWLVLTLLIGSFIPLASCTNLYLCGPDELHFLISTSSENEAVVSFLKEKGVSEAAFDGCSQNGVFFSCQSLDPLPWHPSSLTASKKKAFLVVKEDGSWEAKTSWAAYFTSYQFICENRSTTSSTTTTSSTVAPPTNTSTSSTTSTTSTSTTTTSTTTTTTTTTTTAAPKPPVVLLPLKDFLEEVKKELDSRGDVNVLINTVNDVTISESESLAASLQMQRDNGRAIFISFQGCSESAASALVAVGDSVVFSLPFSVSTEQSTRSICVFGYDYETSTEKLTVKVGASLVVQELLTAFAALPQVVHVKEFDLERESGQTVSVTFSGKGTPVAETTDILPWTNVLFSLVNNGVQGHPCTPSTNTVGYLVSGNRLFLSLSRRQLRSLNEGKKSLCAAVGEKTIVAFTFNVEQFGATTDSPQYTRSSLMPLLVNGVSNTLLAEGKVKVFFSNSDNCKKTVKEGVLLVHNTFSTSSHNAFVAIPDDLADSSKTYVCVSFNSVTSAVTAGGAAVVVSGEGGTPARSVLTVLYGMKGKIDLADYIRGTQSGRDSILETLNDEETSHFIQFVPFSFSVSSNEDDKSEACLRSEEEATLPTDGSILVIKYPLKISRNTGILCLGKKYINIDYEVVSGTDFIHSVDGVTEFSKLPFILSNAPARDVSTIELGANNYGDIGVFYAPDGSDCGDDQALVPLLSHDRSYYAYLPEKEGTYLICAGLTGKRTNVFVSTESVIVVESFERAAEQWKTSIGVGSGEWRTCGSSSLCGSNLQQNYVQVCSPISTNVMQPWPIRLQDVFNYMGSFNVRISFSDVPIPTGLYLNAFFIPVEYGAAHCRLYDKLKMSSDELFSSSAVATLGQTIVYFQDSFDLGSMVIGLTPLDKPCAAKNIVFKSYVNPNGRNSLSSFDASPLVLKMEEKFYALCYLTDSKWTRAGFTIVQTASSPAVPPSRIEAIGAVTSVSEESAIYLWRTQTFAEWNVVGIFYPEESIELALVWDDPTCAAKAAYTTAVRYVSLTGGKLSVDVTAVSEAPKASSVLYSCYRIGDSVLKPLRIDRLKSLTVILQPLSVSSLNYLPRISASYNTKENITVQITDIDNPPVQQVALFKESEKDSSDKSCSTDSSKYVTTLPVTKDSFGHRSFTVPSDVVNRVGVKDTTVYLRLCASAAAEGVLAPVSAYIVLNGWEVDLSVSPVALVFYFTPLNGTTNIAESDGVSSALLSYAKSVGVSNTDDILVTMKATNRYLFYLEPSKDLNSAKSLEETGKLYKALSEGTNLPLYANNQDNNVFVATSVEGVYARDQTAHLSFPFISLSTMDGPTTPTVDVGTSIALFCIIVAPVAIGFVAFSVQRSIPALKRKKLTAKPEETFVESGESPPPRKPYTGTENEEADEEAGGGERDRNVAVPLAVEPNMEDTNANPLYDSDENEHKDLGCSPPVTNSTFVMKT